METNESNIKPHSTGGLKLMTVFVVVLAAHVLVIGGITTYYLVKGGSADIALTDKTNKSSKVASDTTVTTDSSLPDATQGDKTALTPPADTASTSTTPPPPAPDQTASTEASAPSPTASTDGANSTAPTPPSPLLSEMATTPPELAPIPAPSAPPAPTAAVASGPVKMPAIQSEPDAAPVAGTPYVVKAHDSLDKIAHLNHTTVAKLKETNSLNSDMLRIGQKLVIPGRTQVASTTTTAPAASPDSSDAAAVLDGSAPAPSAPVKSIKPAKSVAKTSTPITPTPTIATTAALHHHLYTVVKGDTLIKIAREFKTTPTALMAANNITDASKLSIGKKLKIPSQSTEARSAKNTEPTVATPPSPAPASTSAPTGQLANFIE